MPAQTRLTTPQTTGGARGPVSTGPSSAGSAATQGPSGRGNAANQERLLAQQRAAQERATFETNYRTQKDREVDPAIPRWRRLSDEEAANLPRTPKQPGELGYTTVVNGATYAYDVQANDTENPTRAKDLMGGSASQFYSRAMVTPRVSKDPKDQGKQDVTILNRDGTTTTQRQNDAGMAELPESGFGFNVYNRNDVSSGGKPQKDQWGTPDNIARAVNIAADYRTLFPNSELSYGDLSTDTGDSPLLYTGGRQRHGTHYNGSQVDLGYVHGTGDANVAPTSGDDLFRQRSMVRTAENWGMDYFHASPSLQNKLYFSPGSDEHYDGGHRDHLHMGRGAGGR